MQPLWKTVWSFHKKLNMELPYDPAIPLRGIYLKKTEKLIENNICTLLFIAALFTTTKIWKQLKRTSGDEWIKKEILSNVTSWMLGHLQFPGWDGKPTSTPNVYSQTPTLTLRQSHCCLRCPHTSVVVHTHALTCTDSCGMSCLLSKELRTWGRALGPVSPGNNCCLSIRT